MCLVQHIPSQLSQILASSSPSTNCLCLPPPPPQTVCAFLLPLHKLSVPSSSPSTNCLCLPPPPPQTVCAFLLPLHNLSVPSSSITHSCRLYNPRPLYLLLSNLKGTKTCELRLKSEQITKSKWGIAVALSSSSTQMTNDCSGRGWLMDDKEKSECLEWK